MKASAPPQAEPAAGTLWRCGGRDCGAGECEHEENELHRHASGPGPQYAPGIVHDVLRSPGTPLPEVVRHEMEARLGHDFADVRIHTDGRAGESARQVEALAYTVGRDVVFAPGQFNPGSGAGQRLIAHELTHAASAPVGAPGPSGPLRVSSPEEPAERHAARAATSSGGCGTPVAGHGLMRQQAAPVTLTGVTVNHSRVTVPPAAGLAFAATIVPANASPGVTLAIAGVGGTAINAGTTIVNPGTGVTNAGSITVAASQAGGEAEVQALQNYTLPDGSSYRQTTPSTAPFNFVAVPGAVTGTTASARGNSGEYGANVRQTFAGGRAIERAHVNERFAGATTAQSGTTISLTGAMFTGTATIRVNNPTATSGRGSGWDLDSSGEIVADDEVTWTHAGASARPFIRNASTPTPAATLPQSVDAVQSFHNLTFPAQTYGATAVATVTHKRMFDLRTGSIKAVTRALPGAGTTPEVVEDYMGPPVFTNCRATPTTIAPSAARGRGAPPVNTVDVSVDREGATTPRTTFSIQGNALGCRVNNRTGVVTIGTTAGTITVRGGDAANYDETTITIGTPAPTPAPTPGTPTPGTPTPGTPTPGVPTP